MLKHHFKTAWRTMVKDKTYASINILGLTIGLASFMLVFTVVIDELSYDKFWSRSETLYKLYANDQMAKGIFQKRAYTLDGLGNALKNNFPEVAQYTTISTKEQRLRIGVENPDGIKVRVLNVDTNALSMFDFDPVKGQLPSFVAGQQNLLITESFRDRHFNGEDPIGRIIENVPTVSREKEPFLITGVIKDLPQNTHLRAEAIALTEPVNQPLHKQGYGGLSTVYYLLEPGADAEVVAKKISAWMQDFMENPYDKNRTYGLQPITDVYLQSEYDSEVTVHGNRNTLYVLTGVGILLLLIACINFVNLSTARAMRRIKETGVRKILGAQRSQLVAQFLAESLLFFIISTALGIVLYILALPVAESFIGNSLTHSLLRSPLVFGCTLLVIFLLSVVVGAYPAWLLSGFKPSNTLRGNLFERGFINAGGMRKALIVVQFSLAIIVLVALMVVSYQINYISSKGIGYDPNNLLYVGDRNWESKGATFKTELKKLPGIESAGIGSWNPANGQIPYSVSIDHPFEADERIHVRLLLTDFDFASTIGLRLQSGRFLNADYGTDEYDIAALMEMDSMEEEQYRRSRSAVVTASTATLLGIDKTSVPIPKLGYPAVGILEDFHLESLHHALGPIVIRGAREPYFGDLFIRTTPGMEQQAQESLIKLWDEFYPERLLDAQWVTDLLDKQYGAEQKQQTLFSFFSALTLFLSAMGVFGLIVHAAQQRIKEIGIRKVLGASTSSIVALLSKDFVRLVFIAIIIASPIAWWVMNEWLADFAYRIEIQWWMFAIAGFLAVLIALLTVSYQSIRAARANPVDSLRDE